MSKRFDLAAPRSASPAPVPVALPIPRPDDPSSLTPEAFDEVFDSVMAGTRDITSSVLAELDYLMSATNTRDGRSGFMLNALGACRTFRDLAYVGYRLDEHNVAVALRPALQDAARRTALRQASVLHPSFTPDALEGFLHHALATVRTSRNIMTMRAAAHTIGTLARFGCFGPESPFCEALLTAIQDAYRESLALKREIDLAPHPRPDPVLQARLSLEQSAHTSAHSWLSDALTALPYLPPRLVHRLIDGARSWSASAIPKFFHYAAVMAPERCDLLLAAPVSVPHTLAALVELGVPYPQTEAFRAALARVLRGPDVARDYRSQILDRLFRAQSDRAGVTFAFQQAVELEPELALRWLRTARLYHLALLDDRDMAPLFGHPDPAMRDAALLLLPRLTRAVTITQARAVRATTTTRDDARVPSDASDAYEASEASEVPEPVTPRSSFIPRSRR